MQAMEEARKAGKTKYIGLSEVRSAVCLVSERTLTFPRSQCSAETLRRASKVAKVDFIEVECELIAVLVCAEAD